MTALQPLSPTDSEPDGLPFGVYVLSIVAGLVIMVLGMKSVIQDYRLLYRLTHLDELYQPTPAKWVQVQTRRDTSGAKNDYYPDVLFEYFVKGKSVWGWRLSLEEEPRTREYWIERLRAYHQGGEVTAYVSPNDAKDSFVEKKTDGLLRPLLKVLLGLGFVSAGLLLSLLPLFGWLKKSFHHPGASATPN